MDTLYEPTFIRKKQIDYLHRFVDAAEKAHLGLWVCGGWGVEALTLEEYPREHRDIDFLVFRLYSSAFHVMARRMNFHFAGESYYGFSVSRYDGGAPILVRFGFLDWEDDDRLVTYLPQHTVNWPCGGLLMQPNLPVAGKNVPCCDWEMLYAASQLYTFLNPEDGEAPDAELINQQVDAERRREIAENLIVPCEPA